MVILGWRRWWSLLFCRIAGHSLGSLPVIAVLRVGSHRIVAVLAVLYGLFRLFNTLVLDFPVQLHRCLLLRLGHASSEQSYTMR